MKGLIRLFALTLAATAASPALAETRSLTADEIRSRLEVTGEVYVLDASGKKLVSVGPTKSTWRGSGKAPLESNWGNNGNAYGQIYLRHVWTVKPDATIQVLVEEYARQEEGEGGKVEMKDLLKKSDFTLESFAPITWKVLNNKEKNVFVRLTPTLREQRDPVDIANLPVAGRNVIVSDNKGYLWSDGSSFDGLYVGISTHRGTVALSYKPFDGASPVGEATNDLIILSFPGDLKVKLRSDTAFVPDTVNARVYGLYVPETKTAHPHSTHLFTSSTAEKLIERIRN